jgi:hypothetical protein
MRHKRAFKKKNETTTLMIGQFVSYIFNSSNKTIFWTFDNDIFCNKKVAMDPSVIYIVERRLGNCSTFRGECLYLRPGESTKTDDEWGNAVDIRLVPPVSKLLVLVLSLDCSVIEENVVCNDTFESCFKSGAPNFDLAYFPSLQS